MSDDATPSAVLTQGICVRCAHDADVEIAGIWLCMDCYHVAGSTCAGIASPTPADPTC